MNCRSHPELEERGGDWWTARQRWLALLFPEPEPPEKEGAGPPSPARTGEPPLAANQRPPED